MRAANDHNAGCNLNNSQISKSRQIASKGKFGQVRGASIVKCHFQKPSREKICREIGPISSKGNFIRRYVASGFCSCLVAISLFLASPSSAAIEAEKFLDPDIPVLDLARIVPAVQEDRLIEDLKNLEQRSGWKLRLLTRNGPKQGPTGEEIKRAWAYDKKSGIIICDPTSPNILQFQVGDNVSRLLSRGFFIELQSRYGNKFYVRDEGEASAVLESIKAMETCLESGGCQVVPGLPENQYQLTLITSLIGGCVFGFSTTIQPQGFVKRQFIWPLLFAPLWGTLFVSFGIGPIVTRTQDRLPLLQNFAAFLLAAGVFRLSPLFKPGAVDLDIISKEGQKKRDAENEK